MLSLKTILHPTDFSPNSIYAMDLARALARDYGATLVLLHVRTIPSVAYGDFGTVPLEPAETVEAVKGRLRQLLPTDYSGPVDFHVRDGNPAAEILSLAQESHCDLIVIGTHGRTGVGRLLMGSVAEQLVRKAPCPVLTVKQPMYEIA